MASRTKLLTVPELDDGREAWRVAYPIHEVLLVVTCATIASCDDFDEILAWGEHNLAFLRRFSPFHHGVPCARWLRDLLNRIDPALFAGCLEAWIAEMWPDRHAFIAIDGKTARRTHDRGKGLKALHTLSAYATTARLTLAQLSVPEKTNEITAIPDLLDHLAQAGQLEGALVTIDAMGCQVEIARKIVDHKADYLLALKGNQSTLEADVLDYFRTAPADELTTTTTVEKGHGRIETRTYLASSNVDWIASDRRYPGAPRFPTSPPSSKSTPSPNKPASPPARPGPISPPPPSTSNASPRPLAATGASRACTGSSTSPSRTTSRAIDKATGPGTWRPSAASPSTSSEAINQRAASKPAAKSPAGTRTSSSVCFRSHDR